MKTTCVNEIIKATNGQIINNVAIDNIAIDNVSTDSRTVKKGDAFFALIGDNHDAHDHIAEVCEKGCDVLIVSNADTVPKDFEGAAILVKDTLTAFQDFAAYYRNLIDPVVVAITGSVGKTTLKDMLSQISKEKYNTVYTDKNYNNHIGVPKTIFEMSENTELLILEMGMSAAGEIERLACIARPDIGLISNIGISHRENFDTDDGILNAKMEIASYFGPENTLVINGDFPELVKSAEKDSEAKGYKVICVISEDDDKTYGDYVVKSVKYNDEGKITFEIERSYDTERFVLPTPGMYSGVSAGLAVAASSNLGIAMSEASSALKNLKVTPHRLQPIRQGGILVIDDTYNASPDSTKSGLDYLVAAPGKRKIAVLADMNELGENFREMHMEIGKYATGLGVDVLATYGNKAENIAIGANNCKKENMEVCVFDDKAKLNDFLKKMLKEGDVFYVKGSRTMKMEEVVSNLLA